MELDAAIRSLAGFLALLIIISAFVVLLLFLEREPSSPSERFLTADGEISDQSEVLDLGKAEKKGNDSEEGRARDTAEIVITSIDRNGFGGRFEVELASKEGKSALHQYNELYDGARGQVLQIHI